MDGKRVDALVIGAGPGGYAAAIRLSQLGKRTVLVDRKRLGGVCLNAGCIPSKALITAAKTYEELNSAESIGLRMPGKVSLDFGRMQDWKDGIVERLTKGVAALCKGNDVEFVAGDASFRAANRIRIETGEGEIREIEAGAIVVATGSRPIEIPGFPFDERGILTSSDALSLRELPERLLVIGGGYIGLELGTVFSKLGCETTVLEMTDQLLPGFDRDVVQVVRRNLKKRKVGIHLKTRAIGFERMNGGLLRVELESSRGGKRSIEVDKVLVTVGRAPNSEVRGMRELGVEMEGSFVRVDGRLRTSVPGIYAIGDVAGPPMLAHKAAKEADLAAASIAGVAVEEVDPSVIPSVVFTDPEVATVGCSERELDARGVDYIAGKFPMAALGRALTMGKTDGFVKTLADRSSHILLGVQIVGPHASDLISEAALALELGSKVEDLSRTVHPHPTLSEALMESAKALLGEAVHVQRARKG